MPDLETTALIERLQQSNRRWKRLALSLLATFGLALVLLTTSTVVLWVRAERQARQAEAAAKQARQQQLEARQQQQEARKRAEALFLSPVTSVLGGRQQEQEAKKRSEEALQAVDELQHQDRHP